MCTVTCPKGLDPQTSINELLRMVKERKEVAEERLLWLSAQIIRYNNISLLDWHLIWTNFI